jgi:hypothetical protein
MDTPPVVAYDSKVTLFFSIIIFNARDECTMICVQCHLQKYLHGSCMERMNYETPGLETKYKCSLCSHQVTTLLVV